MPNGLCLSVTEHEDKEDKVRSSINIKLDSFALCNSDTALTPGTPALQRAVFQRVWDREKMKMKSE